MHQDTGWDVGRESELEMWAAEEDVEEEKLSHKAMISEAMRGSADASTAV